MARRPATRLQLGGHRFLLRRTQHALVRGDARMIDDPLRAQAISMTTGAVLAVVVFAVCAATAMLRPGGDLDETPIVMVHDTGALYVRIADTMHPVLNLASARLLAATPANPRPVSARALAGAKRGPLVGIPGAPTQIDPPLGIDESGWTLCDVADPPETVLIVGRTTSDTVGLPGGQAVLVAPRGEGPAATYLVFDGWRAAVDLRDVSVVRALHLEGVAPLMVSRSLLDSVPEAPGIAAPQITDAGAPGPPALGDLGVGTVVRVERAAGHEFYVVLSDGVQRIDPVVADLIRFTVAQPGGQPPVVAADVIATVPFVEALPVRRFPDRVAQGTAETVCAGWDPRQQNSDTNTTVSVGSSLPVPASDGVVLAQSDAEGPNIDRVITPAGRGALVRSTAVVGTGGTAGSVFYLNDRGVLFGVHDERAAEHLGLPGPAVSAPWSMLAVLPRGPELSRDAASVVRDGLTVARAIP
ncbi:type VII secretion protein EccB [Mycobacterium aquaticum]|uniref:Type VII secretion protein EccB n=1 Tax=Mycobacterium aquaticum TaxID=1927124 RepID=A0A1W9ZWX9_9MYCO|nr:type VII secretion protein EccB [Mycobacterium aquaticum]ORA21996.1 type VII secretion protein EccB [Mycobacterium aquaticum]